MLRALGLSALVLTACDARIGGVNGGPNNNGSPDANEPSSTPDSSSGSSPDAPACYNGRVVFLNFKGATLKKAAVSNATADEASWIGVTDPNITTATVPPYRNGLPAAERAQQIATIETNIRMGLSQFPVIVVTERPAAGPYVMIVFGGVNTTLGTPYTIATNELDCGDVNKSDLAWVSDTTVDAKVDDYAIGAIGFGLGLTATTATTDCMCGWANACRQPNDGQCALTPGVVTRDPQASQQCQNVTTQDEQATFDAAFCK